MRIKKDPPLHVLIINSNENEIQKIGAVAKNRPEVFGRLQNKSKLEDGLKAAQEEAPDVILLNLFLPDSKGLDSLKKIKYASPRISIVIVLPNTRGLKVVDLLRYGAQDWIEVDTLNEELFVRVIQHAVQRQKVSNTVRDRVEACHRGLTEIAKLNFEKRLPTFEDDQDLNLLAQGINMLSDELRNSIVSTKDLELIVSERTAEIDMAHHLLEKQMATLQASEAKLKESLKEKELLLREVHHRVKNNLFILSGLLDMQSRRVKNKETQDILLQTKLRVKSMSILHEKLYTNDLVSELDLGDYVKKLGLTIFDSLGVESSKIKLEVDIDYQGVGIDSAINCGIILTEMIINSVKYAFPDDRKGKIHIELIKKDDHNLELSYSDDGVGVPDDMPFPNPESLGTKIIQTIVEYELEGELLISRDSGLEYKIQFEDTKTDRG